MKNFAIIGTGGYVAPRHLQAIKETGNNLVAAIDLHDSVGILDNYFPNADFFTGFERFDRHLEKLKRTGTKVDYICVCSPNYLHDAHIRFGLRYGADVICEKPVVLNPWNLDSLLEIEKETGRKAYSILQLRHHPVLMALKEKIEKGSNTKKHKINLDYITARGRWYHSSWKGDIQKSGGVATNIGIHFFDMLLWIFGNVQHYEVAAHNSSTASGTLILDKAEVEWLLSIDEKKLPEQILKNGKRTFRQLSIDGEVYEFTDGFTDLHTVSYQHILQGTGFRISESKKVIELVSKIRGTS